MLAANTLAFDTLQDVRIRVALLRRLCHGVYRGIVTGFDFGCRPRRFHETLGRPIMLVWACGAMRGLRLTNRR